MSKFNTTNTNTTVNRSGYTAFAMTDKLNLVTKVLTSFYNEPKFYGDTDKELVTLAKKLAVTDPKFISNLAIYTRKEFHLRSVSHVLASIVANVNETKPFISETVTNVVERPDDLTEILACYISMYGKPIPNGLKKALGNNLKKFNEYQLSKYNGGNKAVKFKDILGLCHVKPDNNEQSLLFKKILDNNLDVAERWETEVSKNGNNSESWEKLLADNKLGYMAMLRNMRNMLNAGIDMTNVYAKISDEKEVLKSKQLPFRFYSAYRELEGLPNATNKTTDCLETAIRHSMKNVKKLPGKTVIAYDISGSMSDPISSKSTVKCSDISSLLAVMASYICDEYIVYAFNGRAEKVNIPTNAPILDTARKLSNCSGGTNLTAPINTMLMNNVKADRLIMISDNEINSSGYWSYGFVKTCQSYVDQYRNKLNPNLWVHAIDLQGYGTQQFQGGKTNIIAGWSEKVLDFISLAEDGYDTLVKTIENYR